NCQRVAPVAVVQFEFPFKIHLPQSVGGGPLAASPRALSTGGFLSVKQPSAIQNSGNGRRGWNLIGANVQRSRLGLPTHVMGQLTPAPAAIVIAGILHELLDCFRGFIGTAVGASRAFGQSVESFGPVASQPLITGRPADAEPPAELAHICIWLLGKHNKFCFTFHFGYLLKGHVGLLFRDNNTLFMILVKCKGSPGTPVKDVPGLDTPFKADITHKIWSFCL